MATRSKSPHCSSNPCFRAKSFKWTIPIGRSSVPEYTGIRVIPLSRKTSTRSAFEIVSGTDTISAVGTATSSTRILLRFIIPKLASKVFGALSFDVIASEVTPNTFRSRIRPPDRCDILLFSSGCARCAAPEDPSLSPIFLVQMQGVHLLILCIWGIYTHFAKYFCFNSFHKCGICVSFMIKTHEMQKSMYH